MKAEVLEVVEHVIQRLGTAEGIERFNAEQERAKQASLVLAEYFKVGQEQKFIPVAVSTSDSAKLTNSDVDWINFTTQWFQKFGMEAVQVRDLIGLAESTLGTLDIAGDDKQTNRSKLGTYIGKCCDRTFSRCPYVVTRAGVADTLPHQWQLRLVETAAAEPATKPTPKLSAERVGPAIKWPSWVNLTDICRLVHWSPSLGKERLDEVMAIGLLPKPVRAVSTAPGKRTRRTSMCWQGSKVGALFESGKLTTGYPHIRRRKRSKKNGQSQEPCRLVEKTKQTRPLSDW